MQCGDTFICDGIFYLVRSQQAKSLDEIKLSQIKFCSYFLLQKEYLEKSLYAWYLRPGKSNFDILTPEIHLLWPVCLFFIVCLFVCLFVFYCVFVCLFVQNQIFTSSLLKSIYCAHLSGIQFCCGMKFSLQSIKHLQRNFSTTKYFITIKHFTKKYFFQINIS